MEQEFFKTLPVRKRKPVQPGTPLTPRQQAIVRLIAAGRKNRDIATELGITEGTVKMYISSDIFPRLGVTNRAGVAVAFYQSALLAVLRVFTGVPCRG